MKLVAQDYIDQGWAVVPVPTGSKACLDGDWSTKTYAPADFADDANIATMCGPRSNHRICIDGDCAQAVAAIAEFLPTPTLIEGRPSNSRSHYWYVSEGLKSEPFTDIDQKTMLVEIKASGYVMRPPSLWTDEKHHVAPDENYHVDQNDPIETIPAKRLRSLTVCVAIAALIARHWGASRHHAAGPLTGFLLQLDIEPEWVRRILECAFRIAKDEELGDRLRFVDDTIGSFKVGRPVTGGPTLESFFPKEAIANIRRWVTKGKPAGTEQRVVTFTPADTIEMQPVRWLWDKWMPLGTVGLLAGREGLGKSLEIIWQAAQLTKGTLPGEYKGLPRTVLIAATEDSWEHTIAARLVAAGADLSRVFRVAVATPDGLDDLQLPVDLTGLQDRIVAMGDVAVMYLDPLLSRLSGKLDTHKDAEVRRALEPLVRLADATGITIQGLIHVNKTVTSDPLNSVMGSRAFTAVSRFVHYVIEDPNDESTRLFGLPKNNLGPRNHETRTFQIISAQVPSSDLTLIDTAKLEWTGTDPRSIAQILRESTEMQKQNKSADAVRWLKDRLEQSGGYAESSVVKSEGSIHGFSESTLKRALKKLGGTSHTKGFQGRSWWALPGVNVP